MGRQFNRPLAVVRLIATLHVQEQGSLLNAQRHADRSWRRFKRQEASRRRDDALDHALPVEHGRSINSQGDKELHLGNVKRHGGPEQLLLDIQKLAKTVQRLDRTARNSANAFLFQLQPLFGRGE